MRSTTSGLRRRGRSMGRQQDRAVVQIIAAVVAALSLALVPAGVPIDGWGDMAGATVPMARAQRLPSGEQLIHRMAQAARARQTFHETTTSTTLSAGMRETVRQTLDIDLRHHLLHQLGVDRRVRLNGAAVSRETFERISAGYRSATRTNGGGWSCQRFQPGQVRLIGGSTYLAHVGGPTHAVNLGPARWNGVPVWRVRATVFGGGAAGVVNPPRNGTLFIARSNDTLRHEVWSLGKSTTGRATYARYGAAVHVSLPAGCHVLAPPASERLSVTVPLQPVGGTRVHGRATLTAAGGGTRAVLRVSGLRPGARAGVLIHYGTCSDLAHLSASSASLPNLRAGARGRARATGRVRTAIGGQNVPLSVLADGHHAIVIVLPARGLVACGTIL